MASKEGEDRNNCREEEVKAMEAKETAEPEYFAAFFS